VNTSKEVVTVADAFIYIETKATLLGRDAEGQLVMRLKAGELICAPDWYKIDDDILRVKVTG